MTAMLSRTYVCDDDDAEDCYDSDENIYKRYVFRRTEQLNPPPDITYVSDEEEEGMNCAKRYSVPLDINLGRHSADFTEI